MLIPDGNHLIIEREEREVRPILLCRALSKETSGTIFIMSLVCCDQGSNPQPPAHGANALPLMHLCLTMLLCRLYICMHTCMVLYEQVYILKCSAMHA